MLADCLLTRIGMVRLLLILDSLRVDIYYLRAVVILLTHLHLQHHQL